MKTNRNYFKKLVKKTGSAFGEYTQASIFFGLVGLAVLLLLKKSDILLLINKYSSPQADAFFNTYTLLGLGGLMALLALVFVFIRYYYSVLLMASLLGSGIIIYLFKKVWFVGVLRPTAYLQQSDFFRMVEGVHFHQQGSFPSGHTLTAFATATILALATNNKGLGYVLSGMAVLVAISRVYLLQHFFIDVYVGACLGVGLALALHLVLFRYHKTLKGNLLLDIRRRKQKHTKQLSPNLS